MAHHACLIAGFRGRTGRRSRHRSCKKSRERHREQPLKHSFDVSFVTHGSHFVLQVPADLYRSGTLAFVSFTSRVARGAKLDLTVIAADPAKRGGAFTRGHFSHPSSSAQHATHRGFWLVH
jgi:hypothetical protein